jgi:hypothetical protein
VKDACFWVSVVFAGLSAGLGLYAALVVKVRDNQDAFISDLARQSTYTAFAAASAGMSVLFQAFERGLF